jgi:predicted NAD/FAD-binding protein
VRPLLEAIPYNTNDVYLHTDAALMPRRRPTWSSWNFLGSSRAAADRAAVCVTYWLNNLQRLPAGAPDTFVTLNPPQPPAADKTVRHLRLAHPVYSFASYEAQRKLPTVQVSSSHAPFILPCNLSSFQRVTALHPFSALKQRSARQQAASWTGHYSAAVLNFPKSACRSIEARTLNCH